MFGLASISIRFEASANLLLDRANQPRLKDRLRCALGRRGPETRFPNGGLSIIFAAVFTRHFI